MKKKTTHPKIRMFSKVDISVVVNERVSCVMIVPVVKLHVYVYAPQFEMSNRPVHG